MPPRLGSETFPPAWTRWASLAGRELPPASIHREFEYNSYMLEAAMAGLGAAVAPSAFAAADIERGRLAAPLGFEPTGTRISYLRPRLSDNAAAATFGEWLRSEGRRTAKPSALADRFAPKTDLPDVH
jgi:LysR family glycine cleavage system transcriptional activator